MIARIPPEFTYAVNHLAQLSGCMTIEYIISSKSIILNLKFSYT